MKRLIACWSIVLSAIVLGATPAWSAEGPTQPTNRSLTDPTGDVVDSEGAKLNDARGDVLQATADYMPGGAVQFEVRMAKFTDPVKDPNWNSDSTYLLWTLDTNGDEEADYTIEYATEDGKLYGAVFEVGATDDAPAVCTSPSLSVGPSGGYALRFDTSCIGRPASFAWFVEASYDTNSRDDDAPATEDLVPNEGFSPPLYAPAGSPVAGTGADKPSPAGAVSSSPGAAPAAGGQSNGVAGANGGDATAVSSADSAAVGGSSGAAVAKSETGSSSASASATAASSSNPGEERAGTPGSSAEAAAKVKGTVAATDGSGATKDRSDSSRLILIILTAAVVLLGVIGIVVRTLRSSATVRAED